jgi:16S rRNA (guanine966-N2)-methyltransferase
MADALAALVPHLVPHAIVVVEWSTRSPTPDWPLRLVPAVAKEYGETVLHFADYVG